jgi:chorismate mutase
MSIKTAQEILVGVSLDRPQTGSPPSAADLARWRIRIDAIDAAVVSLLNKRSECANNLGRIKKTLGQPVYVPSRENEVISNVLAHNAGPLTDRAVRRLFERIIDETRSLERHLYQKDAGIAENDVAED